MKFKLAALCKRTDVILSFISNPDTLQRTQTMKTKFDGTYQPRCWFAVVDDYRTIGEQITDKPARV